MKNKSTIFLFVLGLVIPALLIFKSFFSLNPLAWGDSVHFYKENFEEMTSLPSAWVNRENNFGGINRVVWLYPVMLLIGFLGRLGLPSEIIIRLVFYFPAVLISFLSAKFFAKKFGYSLTVQFFTSLIYTLNTYFLLLVDGGQLGVLLAYSLFPLALTYLKKLVEEKKNLGKTFLFLFLLTLFDPRVSVVCLITLLVWIILEAALLKKIPHKKNIFNLGILLVLLALSSLSWLIPLFVFGEGNVSPHVSTLRLTSLLNGLFIYQPHWPENIFGVVTFPPFYFVLAPVLILGGLLIKSRKRDFLFALIFLTFAFLLKGETPPLGEIYKFVVEKVPFGVALRDATKFFGPLLLFAGLSIGVLVGKLRHKLLTLFVYVYLLFLILPALKGELNGNLKVRTHSADFQKIYEKVKNEAGSFRTLWFSERHPLSLQTERKSALDAKNLVELRPFAFFNEGTHDKFNFMQKEDYLEWFKLLGIKYLVFSGNPRVEPKDEEKKEWENLNALVATTSGLLKKDWKTDVPVFEVPEVKPRVFSFEKALAVVGPYSGLTPYLNRFGMVFLEDGTSDPSFLEKVDGDSAMIVFNNKDKEDLVYAFLSKHFLAPGEAVTKKWATYDTNQFLDWKYQLLIRGLDLKDLDYGRGIAFSTEAGEKMEFKLVVAEPGNFNMALRGAGKKGGLPLKVRIDGYEFELDFEKEDLFGWVSQTLYLTKGEKTLILENPSGLKVINVVSVIPEGEFKKAESVVDDLLSEFESVDLTKEEIKEAGGLKEISFKMETPGRYRIEFTQGRWIVLTDSYDSRFRAKGEGERKPLAFYSLVNGFYVGDTDGPLEISFQGQDYLDKGLFLSLAGLLGAIVFFKKRKNV